MYLPLYHGIPTAAWRRSSSTRVEVHQAIIPARLSKVHTLVQLDTTSPRCDGRVIIFILIPERRIHLLYFDKYPEWKPFGLHMVALSSDKFRPPAMVLPTI